MTQPRVRVHVDQPLTDTHSVRLSGGQAHYLGHVMRLVPGDPVLLFNGAEGEWLARIEAQGRIECTLALLERIREPRPEPGPWLAFAPVKKDAIDFIAVKATELGVERLLPVFTRFTQSARVNTDRLRAQAVEAAEQCGRLTVPLVDEPLPLEAMIDRWPAERTLLVCHPGAGARPVRSLLAEENLGPGRLPPGLLIGPEGGLAPSELDALVPLPFVILISLGSRILRADTAALAVLACWQATAGDWQT
jgi:16S rRNA (uracil1498-N3)-methyltransferase